MNCAQSPQDMKLISYKQPYTGSNSSIGGGSSFKIVFQIEWNVDNCQVNQNISEFRGSLPDKMRSP